MNVTQKLKQKSIKKCQKVKENLNIPNMFLKYNGEAYKYQIQQLNYLFKQPLNYSTLTQDELYVLYKKYKSDGHYKNNKNLPSFTSHFVNNMFNENIHFHDKFSDIQNIKSKNNEDIIADLYCNNLNENQHIEENSKIYEILHSNINQDLLKCTETSQLNNMESRIHNKYLYNEENTLSNNNYNYMNHNVQYNNLEILNDIQNIAQSKSNTKKISNVEEDYFTCNLINSQNISKEHQNSRYMNKNLLYNVSDTNMQYENLTNDSEISQENNIHYPVQYNNFSLNPNFYSDFYLNKCNSTTSINNNNCQSLKNAQSICIPHITNLESCFNVKNSITPYPLPLIKSHLEEQSNFNLPIYTDTYSVCNNKKLTHISNDNVNDIQTNFNAYNLNSTVMSDDIHSQINTFIPSCANMINQYN